MKVAVTVLFEETGEEREVVRLCWQCLCTDAAKGSDRYVPFRERSDAPIVSPSGIGHLGHLFRGREWTACGKDATGETWWHRL